MTRLTKPVVREAVQRIRGVPVIVTMHPRGFFEVRLKGRRGRKQEAYTATFEQVFRRGAERAAELLRQEVARKRARERRRKGRY